MEKKRFWLNGIIIGMVFILAACAPMAASNNKAYEVAPMAPEMDGSFAQDNAVVEEQAMEAEERGFVSGSGVSASEVERMVIYNADMRIAVEDPEDVMEMIVRMTQEAGGFVVNSSLSRSQTDRGTLPRVYMTVRIPADRLNSIMDAIKDLTPNPKDDVLSENVSGSDVTAEYTDLRSRLRNLEAAEEALVALMDDAQDPQDVLDVFSELTYYRGEIEIVKGRMQYLEESAAMSALSIEIVAKQSLQPIEIAGWEPRGTVREAVLALINTGQFLVDALIWFGIYCLPFLIPLSVAVYFLIKLIRKRRANKKAKKTEVMETKPPSVNPPATP